MATPPPIKATHYTIKPRADFWETRQLDIVAPAGVVASSLLWPAAMAWLRTHARPGDSFSARVDPPEVRRVVCLTPWVARG